ncbi:unnamed protein product [Euphydryas editha]|uniref:THAP-type domain-containing protein n=1 Tax=Euphydryas editha TaxID=104508 RepID=A0AAU9V5C1_EUPED|nr:unnamed protein product [Euphydryas editha]
MPSSSRFKCHFGCEIDGPLHRFPKPQYPHLERFNVWKFVLAKDIQNKGDIYIYNQIRICNRHFEECYRSQSHRLTANAVPTLNIGSFQLQPMETDGIEHALPIMQPSTALTIKDDQAEGSSELHCMETGVVEHTVMQPSTSALITKDNNLAKQGTMKRRMTINEIQIHKEVAKLKQRLLKFSLKYKSQTLKIRAAEKLSRSKSFLTVIEKMPNDIKTLTSMQLKWKTKARGRRYTIEEKIMALSIYKQSQKAYKLMKTMFVLPSIRSLQKLLSGFTLKPGLNPEIMANLETTVKKMSKEKRLVNLIFDEISLSPGLFYNSALCQITGFEDMGHERHKIIADHALVFMIKGIKSKFKQPICFTFCHGCTKKADLKNLLTNVLKQISSTGLTVVATVCDQSATNLSVIKSLKDDTKAKYLKNEKEHNTLAFELDDIKVFPLFDPPHLLKGMRNNLLSKNLKFIQNGKTKYAKWEHLEMLLKLDVGEDEIRLVNKLTETHVMKEKLPKMKVKYAVQVFSQRVSSTMRFLAKRKILPAECEETADFLFIMDKLFDSLNGHSYQGDAKIYKECLKNNSPHFGFWNELVPIFQSMEFVKDINKNGTEEIKLEKVPSLKNWVHNMETFKEMWEYLNKKHNVTSLLTRNFNQDPLENFFCNIRSNGVRNVNPTYIQFINAFKTLLVNNLNSPHSLGANCEQDDNSAILSLKNLLTRKQEPPIISQSYDIDQLLILMDEIKNNYSNIHEESKKYVAGYIIKKCKTNIFKNCRKCKNDFINNEVGVNSFIYEIDYTKKSLFHPSKNIVNLLDEMYYMIVACLREAPESDCPIEKMRFFIDCNCNYNVISCEKHKSSLIYYISYLAINIIIHSWCKNVNRILDGKITSFDENNPIKVQAFDYCKTHKHKK